MRIGVAPPAAFLEYGEVFEGLAEMFNVQLHSADELADPQWDALILVGLARETALPSKPIFILPGGESSACDGRVIRFESGTAVPVSFRGAQLRDPSIRSCIRLASDDSTEILAHCDGVPVWLRSRERPTTYISGFALPKPSPRPADLPILYANFRRESWAALLPLLDWLKRVVRGEWQAPEIRASIIIDDPNLHATTFGYLNYNALIADATRHNYHAAIATVPLDSWYASRKAVRILRSHPDRISLLIHGNNHTRAELAGFRNPAAALGAVSQALRRISSFERRTGLSVARVMVAPHGACNVATGAAMSLAGFESACISVGSLVHWNPGAKWPPALGMWMACPLGGLPVFHRVGLVDSELHARLMSFLGQAVVFGTHHADFDQLRAIAQTVNAIAPVRWLGAAEIDRSNYTSCRKGNHLEIESFTKRIVIPCSDLDSIAVRVPWIGEWRVPKDGLSPSETLRLPISVSRCGQGLEIEIKSEISSKMLSGKPPRLLWPLARRVLCQSRDRIMPLMYKQEPSRSTPDRDGKGG